MELPLQCLFQRNFLGGISAAYLKCAWQNSFARVGVKENVGGRHCGWGFFENRICPVCWGGSLFNLALSDACKFQFTQKFIIWHAVPRLSGFFSADILKHILCLPSRNSSENIKTHGKYN